MNQVSEDQGQRPEARAPAALPTAAPKTWRRNAPILAKVSEVYERYGFEALDTGAFEYADALGKFLPERRSPQ